MMKRLLIGGLSVVMLAVAVAATAAATAVSGEMTATTRSATSLTIRHSFRGCHAWAVPGEASLKVHHRLVLRVNQSFSVENRDNCGHRLVQTAGPVEVLSDSVVLMSLRPGATIMLEEPGLYEFKTVEDDALAYGVETDQYTGFARMASTGADNVLTLSVLVLADRNHAGL
jgi:hypothetical protein